MAMISTAATVARIPDLSTLAGYAGLACPMPTPRTPFREAGP